MTRMADSIDTTQLQNWFRRIKAGDATAQNELVRAVLGRMERLAHKMLQGFPGVHRFAETGDVLQSAMVRLLRALQEIQPGSVREFFGLAATQIRRELLDLARHFKGQEIHQLRFPEGSQAGRGIDPPDNTEDPQDLESWCRFHEAVEKLPSEEREIVGLIFYHGWSKAEVAELFQVNERTVRRWWQNALLNLTQCIQKDEG